MVNFLSTSPRGFATLVSSGLFNDVHGAGVADPESTAPRRRVCRDCAGEIFISSLMLWWVMERKKGDMDPSITSRPDCKSGPRCENQRNLGQFLFVLIVRYALTDEMFLAIAPSFR